MARDAPADKASPAEHRDAAYVSIHLAILRDALDRPVERRPHGLGRLCRGATFVDMMRDHVDQNLRCGGDRLPLLLGLIDERLGFSIQALCLFDHRLCPIEKIDQRLGRRQRCLDLPELCITETGNVTNELNEPVLQHGPACWLRRTNSLTPGRLPRPPASPILIEAVNDLTFAELYEIYAQEQPNARVALYDHRTRPARRKRSPRHHARHHRVAPAELATRLWVDCQLAGTERRAAHRHCRKG